MAGKREAVREDLRRRLLRSGTALLEELGVDGLRARDITDRAGCALGTLYTCYQDLDDLILHINSGTLGRLADALDTAASRTPDPVDRLETFAHAYVNFAAENANLWGALFDHRLEEGRVAPEWYLKQHEDLFRYLTEPLGVLHPTMTPEQLTARARGLFAAVHGVVSLSVNGRLVGVPGGALKDELTALTRAYAGAAC